jgi:hypothetical protein
MILPLESRKFLAVERVFQQFFREGPGEARIE